MRLPRSGPSPDQKGIETGIPKSLSKIAWSCGPDRARYDRPVREAAAATRLTRGEFITRLTSGFHGQHAIAMQPELLNGWRRSFFELQLRSFESCADGRAPAGQQ